MVRKPEIQYVGQFYVHGSEARELAGKEQKKAKTSLPKAKLEQIRKIYVDPVALGAMVVAVVMLVTLVVGAFGLESVWQEHDTVQAYLSQLKRENAQLEHTYRSSYDLEQIQTTALALGMIPASEAETIYINVTVPEQEPEPTWWDNFLWFVQGLFA